MNGVLVFRNPLRWAYELCEERCFGDFSQHFASWVAEICQGLGLAVYLDKANLCILDGPSLRSALAASRAVVGIVSNEACIPMQI
jgi:hypothetical protein